MFFVTILLNELLAWVRTQTGTSSLRALFYMDEVAGYFPPVKNPPCKPPMLTLLKQARAFGLGITLAAQNPVDLDYKGLSNIGTWFLGRLQTERDKARVLEGLEGAAGQAGQAFDRQQMEQTLASLGSRVFLMNNVHEHQPRVFQTRWAMSYLAGPLARGQISQLMADKKRQLANQPTDSKHEERNSNQDDADSKIQPLNFSTSDPTSPSETRPAVPANIIERFFRNQLTQQTKLQAGLSTPLCIVTGLCTSFEKQQTWTNGKMPNMSSIARPNFLTTCGKAVNRQARTLI